jgi:hypothetical protein
MHGTMNVKFDDECILILVICCKQTGLLHILLQESKPFHKQWCQISWCGSKFHYLTIKMYNSCTGFYKFGNNTYPRRIRRRSNLGHIFLEKKCVLWARKYGKWQFLVSVMHEQLAPRQWKRRPVLVLHDRVRWATVCDVTLRLSLPHIPYVVAGYYT